MCHLSVATLPRLPLSVEIDDIEVCARGVRPGWAHKRACEREPLKALGRPDRSEINHLASSTSLRKLGSGSHWDEWSTE